MKTPTSPQILADILEQAAPIGKILRRRMKSLGIEARIIRGDSSGIVGVLLLPVDSMLPEGCEFLALFSDDRDEDKPHD